MQVPALPWAPSTRDVINELHVGLGSVGPPGFLGSFLVRGGQGSGGGFISSRCFPLRPTPKGVESSGPPRASRVPFQVDLEQGA